MGLDRGRLSWFLLRFYRFVLGLVLLFGSNLLKQCHCGFKTLTGRRNRLAQSVCRKPELLISSAAS
jgi:hypothetical protein